MAWKSWKWPATVCALVLPIVCISGSYYVVRDSQSGCFTGATNDEQSIKSDDARLYLLVRGNCEAPLMLWLHGGPGGAETPLFRLFDHTLERSFLVAYWDQRGAGRSFDSKASPARLTVARHISDLDVVIDYLRSRYGKRKVALVGHSWGSALGLLYAIKHPDKISVVVGVNQFVSGLGAQQGQYAFVRSRAEGLRDYETLKVLRNVGEPPLTAQQELKLQALVDRYGGLFHQRPSFTWAMIVGTLRGYVACWAIPSFIRANEISLMAMQNELNALDLRKTLTDIQVPIVFMLGRYDRQLEEQQAAEYFQAVSAPAKRLIYFEESAHNIPFEEPERFVAALTGVLTDLGE